MTKRWLRLLHDVSHSLQMNIDIKIYKPVYVNPDCCDVSVAFLILVQVLPPISGVCSRGLVLQTCKKCVNRFLAMCTACSLLHLPVPSLCRADCWAPCPIFSACTKESSGVSGLGADPAADSPMVQQPKAKL